MSTTIDRGLVRFTVETYARVMGVTYEDAHQILRSVEPAERDGLAGPDKWMRSRGDEAYRRERMAACRRTWETVRGRYLSRTP